LCSWSGATGASGSDNTIDGSRKRRRQVRTLTVTATATAIATIYRASYRIGGNRCRSGATATADNNHGKRFYGRIGGFYPSECANRKTLRSRAGFFRPKKSRRPNSNHCAWRKFAAHALFAAGTSAMICAT
jgi:hypothetical protein